MSKRVGVFLWNNFVNDARVKREVSALTEAGYTVDVICTYDGDEKKLFDEEVFYNSCVIRVENFKSLKIKWKLKNRKFMFNIAKIIGYTKLDKVIDVILVVGNMTQYGIKGKYDYFHSNDLKTLLQGYFCKKMIPNSRLVYDSHEVETSRAGGKSKVKYILEKILVKHIDCMIMTTQTRAEYNAKLYGIQVPEVIHNYPFYTEGDLTKNNLYEKLGIDKEEPILLYQGGFQKGRGIENILQATKLFQKGIVVFIGDGPLKPTMLKLIEENSIQDKVKLVDKVPSEELLYYTQHAYLGFQVLENICFNHYSALSNKLLEYIMMEVPVVCSQLPEMEKVIQTTGGGVCIDTNNPHEIARSVNYLLEHKNYYDIIKQDCKKNKKMYVWEEEKKKFINVYRYLDRRS